MKRYKLTEADLYLKNQVITKNSKPTPGRILKSWDLLVASLNLTNKEVFRSYRITQEWHRLLLHQEQTNPIVESVKNTLALIHRIQLKLGSVAEFLRNKIK